MNADWRKVLKAMLISGAAGGSLASVAGLLSYIRANKLKESGDTQWDDDTMYVYKKEGSAQFCKEAEDDRFNGKTFGAQLVGVPLAFAGSYLLTNWLINRKLRSDAQDELDAAQLAFVNQSGYEPLKKKSNVGDYVDDIFGIGGAAALLLALTSGTITHQYLQNNWPTKKPKVLSKPKKIKVIGPDDIPQLQDQLTEEQLNSILNKSASADCMQLPARMLCVMDKHASVASNIVHAVAQGRAMEFQNVVDTVGFQSAVDTVKGASNNNVDDNLVQLAVQYCTKEAGFAPQFNLTVAAEYQAMHPEICKEAAAKKPEDILFMQAFAVDASDAIRHDLAVELGALDLGLDKEASVDCDLKQAYENIFEKASASPVLDNSDQQSTEVSNDNQQSASFKSTDQIKQEAAAYRDAQVSPVNDTAQDPIDNMLRDPAKEMDAIRQSKQTSQDSSDSDISSPSSILQTS